MMHKKAALVLVLMGAGVLAITTVGASGDDLTISKTVSVGGNTFSTQSFLKGARERTVMQAGSASNVTIRQCDLHRFLTLNEGSKNYLVHQDLESTGAADATSGGSITYTSEVVDTRERKQAFGYTARHLKITVVAESSASACSAVKQKYEIDGWYIDLQGQGDCQRFSPYLRAVQGCQDKLFFKQKGKGKPGYPVQETMTLLNGDDPPVTLTSEVTELKKGPLDAALFDVPADYHQVATSAELSAPAGAANAPTSAQANQNNPPPGVGPSPGNGQHPSTAGLTGLMTNPATQGATSIEMQRRVWAQAAALGMGPGGGMPNFGGAPGGAQAVAAPQALGPKAAGRIRIGVVAPQAQMGQGSNAQMDYATPLRNAIIQMMSGPAVEVTAIDARIPVQIEAEAKQKECDFLLYSTLTVKHGGGGGFGKLMSMAGPMAGMAGMAGGKAGGVGAAASQIGAQAAAQEAQAQAQQSMSQMLGGVNSQIKNKDEVTMTYQLFPAGQDSAKLVNTLQAKAKSDGEDVLTPMITQVATAVLTEVTKK